MQLLGDESVLWIGGIELLLGTPGCVLGGLQIALQGCGDLIPLLRLLFAGQDRCLYRCGLNHTEHLAADRIVCRHTPKGDAAPFAVIQESAPARVSKYIVAAAGVTYRQLMAASAATQESSQEGLAAASGTQ